MKEPVTLSCTKCEHSIECEYDQLHDHYHIEWNVEYDGYNSIPYPVCSKCFSSNSLNVLWTDENDVPFHVCIIEHIFDADMYIESLNRID